MPELVAPAGTPEKLITALHFGADAVYLGLKRFSLRSFAGNFDWDELEWALAYARERGRRVYVAMNIQPFDPEMGDLEKALVRLGQLGPDAVVVADPGVLALGRRRVPGQRFHLSTQASVTNVEAANFWFDQEIRRIVLARELHLDHLAVLGPAARHRGGELEVFVHGAVCVSWSGRCFSSLWWSHRDPRHGACAQACRWPFIAIEEARKPGRVHAVAGDERGTYFFDARDLCALPVLDRLVATGVRALKIEGRTRSVAYVGLAVDAYRTALDLLTRGDTDGFHASIPRLTDELFSVCKRGFSTHFLTGAENHPDTSLPAGSPVGGEGNFFGKVVAVGSDHWDLEIRNPVRPGQTLELCDAGMRRVCHTLATLHAADGTLLDMARPGDRIRVAGPALVQVEALAREPLGQVPRSGVGTCTPAM